MFALDLFFVQSFAPQALSLTFIDLSSFSILFPLMGAERNIAQHYQTGWGRHAGSAKNRRAFSAQDLMNTYN